MNWIGGFLRVFFKVGWGVEVEVEVEEVVK